MGLFVDTGKDDKYMANALAKFSASRTMENYEVLEAALKISIMDEAVWYMPYSDEDCGYGSFRDRSSGEDAGRKYYIMLKTNKDILMMPVFTSPEEAKNGPETKLIPVKAINILKKVLDSRYTEYLAVNPWGKNMALHKDLINYVLTQTGEEPWHIRISL